jgi:CubicO group peptidase (beta-lactamase class C family)
MVVPGVVAGGVLALDAPVADTWPEFAARGKHRITLRDVLCHRAGLAAVEGDLSLEEVFAWDPVCAAIAAQAPNWEPGSAHGYHARSYGWILGEVVRRATGQTLGRVFAEEVAGPLGLDCWIGLPAAEASRVATVYGPPEPSDPEAIALRDRFMGPDTLLGRVLAGPSGLFSYGDLWNRPDLRAAEMPSSNGIATARALSRCYAATLDEVDGVRLLAPATLAAAVEPQVEGADQVIMIPTRFALGFALPPMLGESCPEGSFGHPGAGGSLGFADPARGLAFGYVMNQMRTGITGDPRAARLVAAVYEAIG